MTENGVEPHIISIVPKVPEPPKHPELRPGHIWSPKESKEIFQHLRPRVALIKLKHEKKYIRNLGGGVEVEDESDWVPIKIKTICEVKLSRMSNEDVK